VKQIHPVGELAELLEEFDRIGGVVEYDFFHEDRAGTPESFHREAAIAGLPHHQRNEHLLNGGPISWETFWGTDDVEPKQIADNAWSTAGVDGYKTAFFLPPHDLAGSPEEKRRLFERINRHVFGANPANVEIFGWSTNWSDYFDQGHEWWGAFYWTIRPRRGRDFVVIGASATD